MAILTAKVAIRGEREILWHAFGMESIPLEKKEKSGVAGNNPDEWRDSVLCTKEGQLYIRHDYVFSCFREAAKNTKKGRGSIQKLVAATLQVMDSIILIEDRFIPGFENGELPDALPINEYELPVYLDVRGAVNPTTRGRNVRYRVACSPGWRCSFTIMWEATVVDRGQMQAVAVDAGRLVGLGNGRSIGLGRFEIESFEITE
jgi:hypothetical protein